MEYLAAITLFTHECKCSVLHDAISVIYLTGGKQYMSEQRAHAVAAYNSVADKLINAKKEENIRYAVELGYLGLIMETEKYYR